jgi:phytoene dehydrogenase-like protein
MSTSSMHISLGLDDAIDLRAMGLEGGYNVITTGRGTFARLFDAFDRGELGCSSSCFHTAVICPSLVTGGKPSLTIRAVPMPMADWSHLRKSDPAAYAVRKRAVADFFIEQVERYAIADLRRHIQVVDIATPATFARYTRSLQGQNYDMAPYPDNFGRRRLPMRTPIKGLYQPKFSNGIWPCMMAGLQAVDMMLGGAVMHGYSRYSPDRDPPAPRGRRAG